MNRIIFWLHSIISFIFPASLEVQRLEAMTATEFLKTATSAPSHVIENIFSLFFYKDRLVHTALWELKYKGNRKIAALFATLLHEKIQNTLKDQAVFLHFTDPVLIPLPLSKQRRKARGWNQSEMIIQQLMRINSSLFTADYTSLQKIKHTVPQTTLSRKARLENLKHCFAVTDPEKIKNKNIILIDDVSTTGSTIQEAMDTLYKAGAKKVVGFTIAH